MQKRTVKFYSEGVRLEGDLCLPSDLKAGERRPGIVLCHGFTGLRALILGDYAKVFVDAGFVALTFDYRGFGGSEGEKWRLIPLEQIDDIRNAISFFESQPQVDPDLDSIELLILDDIGYVKQSPEEAEVLFTLIAERYERRSMLITSNLVFSDWGRIFKDPMATAAAIDRLVYHATILEFNVPSYRTRKRRRTDAGQPGEAVDASAD